MTEKTKTIVIKPAQEAETIDVLDVPDGTEIKPGDEFFHTTRGGFSEVVSDPGTSRLVGVDPRNVLPCERYYLVKRAEPPTTEFRVGDFVLIGWKRASGQEVPEGETWVNIYDEWGYFAVRRPSWFIPTGDNVVKLDTSRPDCIQYRPLPKEAK